MRVLLVDDDSGTRLLVGSLLRQEGFVVRSFGSGEPVVSVGSSLSFDLAVLDWELPGMSGLDLCRWIRDQPWGDGVYTMMLTVRNRAADLQEALEAGANDFLSKPVDPETLKVRLQIARRLLSIRRQYNGSDT